MAATVMLCVDVPFQTGLLSGAVSVLLSLIAREHRESSCSSSASVLEIEIELHRTQEQLEKIQKQLQEQADELRRKNEEVLDLTSKVSCIVTLFNI